MSSRRLRLISPLTAVAFLAALGGCGDPSPEAPERTGTASAEAPERVDQEARAAVLEAARAAFDEIEIPFELSDAAVLERCQAALTHARVTPHHVIRVLQTDPSGLSAAAAAFSRSLGIDREALEKALLQEAEGDAYMSAMALMQASSELDEAVRVGMRFLDAGGQQAMVGHALLRGVTLQMIEPDPWTWKPGVLVEVDPESWAWMRDAAPSYAELLNRVLSRIVESSRPDNAPREARQIIKMLYFGQLHPDLETFWSTPPEQMDRWVERLRRNATLGDVKEHIHTLQKLVESYIVWRRNLR